MFGLDDHQPRLAEGADVVRALEEGTGGLFDMEALGEDDLEMLGGFGRPFGARRRETRGRR